MTLSVHTTWRVYGQDLQSVAPPSPRASLSFKISGLTGFARHHEAAGNRKDNWQPTLEDGVSNTDRLPNVLEEWD